MDTSKELVASFFKEGGHAAYRRSIESIHSEYLTGEGRQAFDFCHDYFQTYGSLPPLDLLETKTGTKVPIDAQLADVEFYLKDLHDHRLQLLTKGVLADVSKLLTSWKPREAFELLEAKVREIRADGVVGSQIAELHKLGKIVWDRYLQIKEGKRGILLPWDHINDVTLGLWPNDLVLFIARVGIGKSWVAAQIALAAWEANKKVLFATTEMEQDRIAQRIFALKGSVNYSEFTSGKMGEFAEQNFLTMLSGLKQHGFHIVGGDFDFELGNFESAIDQCEPDIVILDGAYLLKVPGANRVEQAANAFNELKRLNSRIKKPIVTTMQFNREVKANQATSVRTESIALTDVASWNASLIYGLIQTEDMKKEKRMIFKNLKAREGVGTDFECNWDLDTMNFSQLGIIDKIVDAPGSDDGGGGPGGAAGGGKWPKKEKSAPKAAPSDANEDGYTF